MEIPKYKVKQAMEEIRLEETRSEKIDKKAIIDRFMTSMETV